MSGIVKIGQTMTMVLAIKDDENKFDMLVRNCVAHDGKRAPIQLVDQYGCVTRPKIMSRFHKIKNFGASASVVSYAYFQAFKFPDSMNVHFQCVIQVCRFQCPEPKCGGEEVYGPPGLGGPIGNNNQSTNSLINTLLISLINNLILSPDPRIPHGAYSESKESLAASPAPPGVDQSPASSVSKPVQVPAPVSMPQQMAHHGPPPAFNKPHPLGGPLPQPSHVMLPPPPRGHHHGPPAGYPNVKREGTVAENEDDEEDEEEEEPESSNVATPTFAALGGRPRSVDFEKAERMPRAQNHAQEHSHARRRRSMAEDEEPDRFFTVHINHVYKRSAQEMTDVETTRVIQVGYRY